MPRARQRLSSGGASLATLLRADRFRLGPRTARVQANLLTHGGAEDARAPAWIGDDLPPHGAPSITLGAARGTLGPHSFGFLDNSRGVAAYAGALPERPRPGSIALVCARRDALPDVAPLAVARGLGVSWIISVGDGDAAETLAFLAADPATRAILLAAPADPVAIPALGKPLVVLGGDPLLRAAARRTGGAAVDDLEAWLAHAALLETGVAKPSRPVAVVAGGGASVLAAAARAAGLTLPLTVLPDDDPDQLAAEVATAAAGGDLLVLSAPVAAPATPPSLRLDLGHAERVRALCRALADLTAPPPPPIPRIKGDRAAATAIVEAAAGAPLTDHETKQILRAYGVRVSRQALRGSATAAAAIAAQIGYPVDVVAAESTRRAATAAEVKRFAALLLAGADFVTIREAFPDEPRARLSVRRGRGLGPIARIESKNGEERALLPLDRADALVLARAASGDDSRPLVELLACATAAAHELDLSLDLDLFVGDLPAVVAASAHR